MGYYEFTVTVPDISKDALIQKMASLGCLGLSDKNGCFTAYFKDTHDITRLRDELNAFRTVLARSGLNGGFTFDYLYLADKDWNEPWKEKFVPIDVGESLSIIPPWEKAGKGRIPLFIDPGMAFGTGHHETTRTCLVLMERFAKEIPRESFLDIGTGTGILAIAASRLGFRRVIGVDTDLLAVDAAQRNIQINGLTNIDIVRGSSSDIAGLFSMIAANLVSGTLIKIASKIRSLLDDKGIAVLSGMLAGQEGQVTEEMENSGLQLTEEHYDGRWVSLVVTH